MEVNDTLRLVFGHHPDWGEAGLLTLCSAIILAEIGLSLRRYIRERGSHRTRLFTISLRALALLLGLALCLELTLRSETRSPSRSRVVILVDDSQSMLLEDQFPNQLSKSSRKPRWKRVEEFWQRSREVVQHWRESGRIVEIIRFGQRSQHETSLDSALYKNPPKQTASHLAAALSSIQDDHQSHQYPLAAIVILSDGLVAHDHASDEYIDAIAKELQVPITTFAAGAEKIVDLGLINLRAGEFAFVENITTFEVDLVSHGIDHEMPARVELRRNGKIIDSKTVKLRPNSHKLALTFRHAPDRTGQFIYELIVLPLENEATVLNNRRSFVVKVLRDKVRVLHVAGRPNWDVRALRSLLKRDPNVELLSYYILRDREDLDRDDSSAPLSLIQFPTDELFNEQLGSFDLLILHNFDAQTHNDPLGADYVHNIADYVREGGSLVIIGGDLGLATGDYAQSSLVPLVPIDIQKATGLSFDHFHPKLSSAGRRHPITSWMADISPTLWQELPELDSFNPSSLRVNAKKIRAAALLVNPRNSDSSGSAPPLLAVSEPEKGRVVTISTGSLWRYGFAPNLPLIDGTRPYDRLWLNIVRWLLRDEQAARLQLDAELSQFDQDRSVELRAQTWDPRYHPQANAKLTWTLSLLSNDLSESSSDTGDSDSRPGNEQPSQVRPVQSPELNSSNSPIASTQSPDIPIRNGQLITNVDGKASHRLEELQAGAYLVQAEWNERANKDETMRVKRVFVIGNDPHEMIEVDSTAGKERLQRLSKDSKGIFLNSSSTLPQNLPTRAWDADREPLWHIDRRHDTPLWNGWIVLLVFLLSFAGEWWLRRSNGDA